METKLISLCMIVKNEADNLRRCLESVQGIVDEMVIVDTGSTDETPEIANEFGARLFHYAWTGSFSEARNVSLEHAAGEWILFLDADEVLAKGKEEIRKLLTEDSCHEGFFLPVVSFTGVHAYRDAAVHGAFRLFRNCPDYRFTRALHEQIAAVILQKKVGAEFAFLPVFIDHFGYLNHVIVNKAKVARNFELAKREVQENPTDAFAWHNLAVEYLRTWRIQAALYCYKRAFFHAGSLVHGFVPEVLKSISGCLINLKRYNDALQVLREAQQAYPDFVDLVFLEGRIHMERGQRKTAAQTFKRCLAIGESSVFVYLTEEGVGSYKALYRLAECAKQAGSLAEAVRYLEESIKQALDRGRYFEAGIHELIATQVTFGEPPSQIVSRFDRLCGHSHASDPTLASLIAKSLVECRPVSEQALITAESLLKKTLTGKAPSQDTERTFALGAVCLYSRQYAEAARWYDGVPLASPEGAQAWLKGIVAHALAGDWDIVEGRLNPASVVGDEAQAIREFYTKMIELWRNGVPHARIEPPRFTARGNMWDFLADLLWDTLGLLIQVQEFEYFERTMPMLQALGISQGDASRRLGKLYYRYGFRDFALPALVQAAQVNSADEESFSMLGRMCLDNGLYRESELFFGEALRRAKNGSGWKACVGIASALLAQGKGTQAELALRGAQMMSQ